MSLSLKDVTVTASGKHLIDGVNIDLLASKLTVVLGANGAGKSTALNVIAGDQCPSRGDVLLDGKPLRTFTPGQLARRRAVVLQHTPINFALCVHEVIALSRTLFSHGGRFCDGIEERAMRQLGLLPLAARDYSTLSGGERQRVQIARALAQLWHHAEPPATSYLLMDEPTAHLDLKHQIMALEAARAFVDDGGSALCILHDLGLAREFSDEIILMKNGRIAANGAAMTLFTPELIADIYEITDQRARQLALTS